MVLLCSGSADVEPLPEIYSEFQTFQNTLNPVPECSKRISCDYCHFPVPEHSAGCPVLEVRLKINPDHAEERKITGAVKKIIANVENGVSEKKRSRNARRKIPKIKINESGVGGFGWITPLFEPRHQLRFSQGNENRQMRNLDTVELH